MLRGVIIALSLNTLWIAGAQALDLGATDVPITSAGLARLEAERQAEEQKAVDQQVEKNNWSALATQACAADTTIVLNLPASVEAAKAKPVRKASIRTRTLSAEAPVPNRRIR